MHGKVFFVSGIVRSVSSDAVENYFAQFDSSAKFILEKDAQNRSRGYGWLRIANSNIDLEAHNPHVINSRYITVKSSNDEPDGIFRNRESSTREQASFSVEESKKMEVSGSVATAHTSDSVPLSTNFMTANNRFICVPLSVCPVSIAFDPRVSFARLDESGLCFCPPPWNYFMINPYQA